LWLFPLPALFRIRRFHLRIDYSSAEFFRRKSGTLCVLLIGRGLRFYFDQIVAEGVNGPSVEPLRLYSPLGRAEKFPQSVLIFAVSRSFKDWLVPGLLRPEFFNPATGVVWPLGDFGEGAPEAACSTKLDCKFLFMLINRTVIL
jgi:hypothetical protein